MSKPSHSKRTLTHRRMTQPSTDTASELRALLSVLKQPQSLQSPIFRSQSVQIAYKKNHQQQQHSLKRSLMLPRFNLNKQTEIKNKQRQQKIIKNYMKDDFIVQKKRSQSKFKNKKRRKMLKNIPKIQLKKQKDDRLDKKNKNNIKLTIQDQEFQQYKSQFKTIDQKRKKQYSLRQEPMKHYVENKNERKKREWKQTNPLKFKTYFAIMKQKTTANTFKFFSADGSNKKLIKRKLPNQKQVIAFIKNYRPNFVEIKIQELIRQKTFIVDLGENYLYFGQGFQRIKEGKGILLTQDYLFEGIWHDNQKIKGYQQTQTGIYNGNFFNDKKQGRGEFNCKNGELYSGEWKQGKRHGVGLWTCPSGHSYMGQWSSNIVEGQGVHIMKNGQRYEGSFKNFLKHGKGIQRFPNGDRYQGNYVQGQPQGKGFYLWLDGTEYDGEFKQGLRHGEGKISTNYGFNYNGNFVRQQAQGKCLINYGNGSIYQGNVKAGQRNGRGVLKLETERKIFDGFWKDSQFTDQKGY